EKITIYGDYDVDGITSVSILYKYLDSKGAVEEYYIPSRDSDGYGLGKNAIDSISEGGTKLIITVDNGITAVDEVEYISSLGMDTVITDHHKCRDIIPPAYAVVNPQQKDCEYPFKELAGVGVAFKLICAIELEYENGGEYSLDIIKKMCRRYIEFVMIGTIADVMPLEDENRVMVYMGLSLINKTENMGIKALFESAGYDFSRKDCKKVTSSVIGYTISPRINAVGRISSADRAVKLFLSSSKEEADYLAEEFCEINKERQELENEIFRDAVRRIEEERMQETDAVIVLSSDFWHHGVIGIVASRITEKYNRPSLLISFDTGNGAENIGKGSARSVKGINIVELFSLAGDLLEKYGGHELAAGLSVKRENILALRRRLNECAARLLNGKMPEVTLDIDAIISASDINTENIDDIMRLEPFGASNPQPVFAMENAEIADMVSLSEGKHTKMVLREGGSAISALFFGADLAKEGFSVGDIVSVAGTLNINEYRWERTPQMICRDIILAYSYREEIKKAERYFEDIIAGDVLIDVSDIPEHEDFAAVYTFLRKSFPRGGGTVSIKKIAEESEEPYIKILCAFRVFYEAALITYDKVSDFDYRIKLIPAEGKSDLSKTELMKKILHLNSKTKF
ncbi:MAG: single-stranded-DNA-specific exonuclease RecJ, partial [Eubacteriales bacterium]